MDPQSLMTAGPVGAVYTLAAIGLLAGAGLLVFTLRLSTADARRRRALEAARRALALAEARAGEAGRLAGELEAAASARSELEKTLAAAEARLAERERSLADMKERLETEFRAAAAKTLNEAHEAFLQRANETFSRHRETESADAERRRETLEKLIGPMRETLTRYEQGLTDMRLESRKTTGELVGRIGDLARSANDVRQEAQRLSAALRAGPKVRGRWGEEQLRNIVEHAGLSAHVDFVEQTAHDDGDRRRLPDMVVTLPGGRYLAVDAKVSLNAYLDAVEADTDAARAAHLDRHAADLRTHVRALAAREYAASLRDSLDFVVLFLPGENYFAAAMETRPDLFQEAFDRKVLIATPTTLLAILKSAAYGWRQEKAAQNAVAVAAMAKDVYESLRKMGEHLTGLGKALDGAVRKYNDLVGGVEARVMPRARRFAEYELPGTELAIDAPPLVDNRTRIPRPGRDLLPPAPENAPVNAPEDAPIVASDTVPPARDDAA